MYSAVSSLVQHYFEYLRSPSVLLAIFIVVGPILLEAFKNYKLAPVASSTKIPGCFRLGTSKQSKLNDQYAQIPPEPTSSKNVRIQALFTYPVKSCRGVELAASEVGPTGLKYDRLFTFAQLVSKERKTTSSVPKDDLEDAAEDSKSEWRFITQREFPRLALIETELWVPKPASKHKPNGLGRKKTGAEAAKVDSPEVVQNHWTPNGGCLVLRLPLQPTFNPFKSRPDNNTIYLPIAPSAQHMETKGYTLEPLSIWIDNVQAVNVTNEIDPADLAKLKAFLGIGTPLGLFRVDTGHQRAITRSLPKDRADEKYAVGFADAFPFHLLNLASVRAQDDELPSTSPLKGRLDAKRFRANVYVTGPPAYDEDTWKRVTMGRCIKLADEVAAKSRAKTRQTAMVSGKVVVEMDGEYHVACRTARCKLPNVDQDSGLKDNNEPLTTLSRTRKVDTGAYPHPCLGMQMIPLFQQGMLRVGDGIQVLERGEHVYEKMFP